MGTYWEIEETIGKMVVNHCLFAVISVSGGMVYMIYPLYDYLIYGTGRANDDVNHRIFTLSW